MAEVFDAQRADRRDRTAFWLETVCQQILPVHIDLRHDAVPQAAMACARLGALRIRDVVGGDHVYVRTATDIRRGDPDTFQIGTPLSGSSILVQDDREAVLNAGDMVLYDSARPFSLVMHDRFHWQVFLLPKSKLRRSEAELRQLTAVRMNSSAGMANIVSRFLRNLAKQSSVLEADPTAGALGENAADLIATLVQSEFGRPWDVCDIDSVLRQRILAFLVDQHADPHLAPAAIAAAHGISVRKLHLLFADSGQTVMERLRAERLQAIHRDLADPRLASQPIGRIAASHGMANPTVFARAFRSVFGVAPREYRAGALARS